MEILNVDPQKGTVTLATNTQFTTFNLRELAELHQEYMRLNIANKMVQNFPDYGITAEEAYNLSFGVMRKMAEIEEEKGFSDIEESMIQETLQENGYEDKSLEDE